MILPPMLKRPWSDWALIFLASSFGASIVFSVTDGLIAAAWQNDPHNLWLTALKTWTADFRYLADQVLYASVILLVGAKFFETRTVLTIGFDKIDPAKMAVLGPDDEGFIWVGRKYTSRFEGEAVVAALKARIQESV